MKQTLTSVISFLILLSFYLPINAQVNSVTLSGKLLDSISRTPLPFVNIILKTISDSSFVSGTITNEQGEFELSHITPNSYLLEITSIEYNKLQKEVFVGVSSEYLHLGTLLMTIRNHSLGELVISAEQVEIGTKMDKKTYSVEDNISQTGGSVLQVMENLPGITIHDGKVHLRGSDQIIVLIDGRQSALTGFGSQSGLDNLPASSIERIEIINNPSSKFDANGNAGIINIILKKDKKDGFNGKVGLTNGVGALWIKKSNLADVRPQYQYTPKINPSIAVNYQKNKLNTYIQVDNLYTQTLKKNEFVTRTYDNGTQVVQQTVRNRNTNFLTTKAGLDWYINDRNQFNASGMYGSEKIIDHGDQPFYNGITNERIRLWQFLEDELKTTVAGNVIYQHKFKQPGRLLNTGFNYTFHREDEKYFFTNILANYTGEESFKLISDEHVGDFNLDYIHPLKYGQLETGIKMRIRTIPTDMQFFPSAQSPLDSNAGGKATYKEIIPAIYGNYSFDSKKWEGEAGLRIEYVNLQYNVDPNHNTYKSDGYDYFQPFPNLRIGYKINDKNKLVAFYNRRVDRPNEVDVRIFPKYDDAEIIKVGNPSLSPQFTNTVELSYKHSLKQGFLYSAAYGRFSDGTIARISTTVDSSNLIYAIFQNAGKSNQSGIELILSQDVTDHFTYNMVINTYYNQIEAFTVQNLYPVTHVFTAIKQSAISGNAKMNLTYHFKKDWNLQITAIYFAPDVVPQGQTAARFTLNGGIKKSIQKSKGEFILNASDLLNTMVIRKTIQGNNFSYTTSDYYETQVVRLGYSYKF
ncbi:MAG: TonB-dependent receptor [Flavobacteriales bacterium]|nr:TonB-dependent receptor [Flavobacteriales bacterium]